MCFQNRMKMTIKSTASQLQLTFYFVKHQLNDTLLLKKRITKINNLKISLASYSCLKEKFNLSQQILSIKKVPIKILADFWPSILLHRFRKAFRFSSRLENF